MARETLHLSSQKTKQQNHQKSKRDDRFFEKPKGRHEIIYSNISDEDAWRIANSLTPEQQNLYNQKRLQQRPRF